MKTFLRWVCLALAFIWLWGCSSEQPGPPEKISTLIIGTGRDATQPGNFQPFGMWEPACLIYETLVNLDTKTEPVPCLAKSWQVSNDGRTYIFDLREKIYFHDGTPFDAQAVAENFNKIGRTGWQVLGRLIKEVRVEGKYQVAFDLNRPSLLFLIHLAASSHGMVSPLAIEAKMPKNTASQKMDMAANPMNKTIMAKENMTTVKGGMPPAMRKAMDMGKGKSWVVTRPTGTGPYIWDQASYKRARTFAVNANSDYWQGKPGFKRIVWEVIPDTNARSLALETGEIHITGLTPNSALGRENLDSLKKNPNMAFATGSNWGARLLVVNLHRPPFDRPGVRQAMQLALDTDEIQAFLGDTARVCTGPLGPDTPYTRPGLALAPFDPEQAKAILDKEGIKDTDKDGIREFGGKPFSLNLIATKNQGLAVMVCQRLKAVGIDARVNPREGGSVFEIIRQGDYDVISHPNIPSFFLDLYGAFHSESWLSAHLNDPDLDRLLERARQCPNKGQFLNLTWEIQDRILDTGMILMGINESKNAVFRKDLVQFAFPPEEWVGAAQDLWRMN